MANWIRPYGHSEGAFWVFPADAYDADSDPPVTSAYVVIEERQSSDALNFCTVHIYSATKIRVYPDFTGEGNYIGHLSYGDAAGWHSAEDFQVYMDYVELAITPTGAVSAVRVSATNDEYDEPYTFSLFDVQVWGETEAPPGTAVLTGTAVPTITETNVVAGGKTIIITLTNDTWVATVGQDNAITTALIAGIDSAQSEATGWDAVVKAHMVYTDVVRTSDTVVTVTLGDETTYNITATETITVTIPATAVTLGVQIVATPTFTVTVVVLGTNMKINIGDVFKDVDSMKINIGDVWKDVVEAKINIGDTWKIVF